METQLLTSQR